MRSLNERSGASVNSKSGTKRDAKNTTVGFPYNEFVQISCFYESMLALFARKDPRFRDFAPLPAGSEKT